MELNIEKLKKITKSLELLRDKGYDAVYDADRNVVVMTVDSIIKNSTISEISVEKTEKNISKIHSFIENKADDLITVGERIRDRKLGSYFERQNLRKAGALARNMYKSKYGKNPAQNAKKTLIYPRSDISILDEAINNIIEKMSSNSEE